MANQNAVLDDNAFQALTAHSGTAGTAETRRITSENTPGALDVHIAGGGASGGTSINVVTGTQQTLGTVGTVIGIGTLSNIGALPQVSVGTVPQVSIGTLPTVTLDNYGTNVNVTTGTQETLGTVGTLLGIGTLTNIGNLPQISIGTLPTVALDNYGTTVNIVTGTQQTLGTVGNLNNGTIRMNHLPVGSAVISTHTLGTGGGTQVGTIVAPTGAGTSLYLAGLSIVVHSGTVDCGIANNVAGTTGAGVFARGLFVPSAGIARDFVPVKDLGANGTIAFFMISPGTVSFNVDYWVTP